VIVLPQKKPSVENSNLVNWPIIRDIYTIGNATDIIACVEIAEGGRFLGEHGLLALGSKEERMGIISWIVLGLIAGFIGSKIVDKQGQGFLAQYRARNHRRTRRRLFV
jgi:hypothetical protein